MTKKSESSALLQRYKDRRARLIAVGCPWVNAPRKTPSGTFDIPTLNETLYWDYVAGVIDLHEAACQFHKSGCDNYVDEESTMRRFRETDRKYHKLND